MHDDVPMARRRIVQTSAPLDMTGLRVVVADDDVLLREGLLQLLIHAGMEVVGRAGDAIALMSLIASSVPDVAIVDIRMPPTGTSEGLDAARILRNSHLGPASWCCPPTSRWNTPRSCSPVTGGLATY